jgi:hypothetical protein
MPAEGLSAVSNFSVIATPVRATPAAAQRYPSWEKPAAHAAWNYRSCRSLHRAAYEQPFEKSGFFWESLTLAWSYLTRDP